MGGFFGTGGGSRLSWWGEDGRGWGGVVGRGEHFRKKTDIFVSVLVCMYIVCRLGTFNYVEVDLLAWSVPAHETSFTTMQMKQCSIFLLTPQMSLKDYSGLLGLIFRVVAIISIS